MENMLLVTLCVCLIALGAIAITGTMEIVGVM